MRRRRTAIAQSVAAQRRTLAALCGRLDLVQRDAETALAALTEAESRIADLEARVFAGDVGHRDSHKGCAYGAMIATWAPPERDPRVNVGPARAGETNQ